MKASKIIKIQKKLTSSGLLLRPVIMSGTLFDAVNAEVDLEIKNQCKEISRIKKTLQ